MYKCRFCGGKKWVRRFQLQDDLVGEQFSVQVCSDCGIGRTDPEISQKLLYGKYYSNYRGAKTGEKFFPVLDKIFDWMKEDRARRMYNLANEKLVIDVGCGKAVELKWIAKRGGHVLGIEYSNEYARNIAKETGVPVIGGELEDIDIKPGSAEVITFWHSLEHLQNANEWLEKSIRWLSKSGKLIIAVPNLEGDETKMFGKYWFHLDVPRHVWHFSESSLVDMVTKMGMKCVGVRRMALEYDFFSCLQSVMNFIFWPKRNRFYIMTMRGRNKELDNTEKIVQLMVLPFALIFTVIIYVILMMKQNGGTMELIFEKKK